jgi:hypothetical protein
MAHPQTKNQTQAAITARCPPKSALLTASRWLTKANILEAIEKRKLEVMDYAQVTPEEVLGSAVFQMRSSRGIRHKPLIFYSSVFNAIREFGMAAYL